MVHILYLYIIINNYGNSIISVSTCNLALLIVCFFDSIRIFPHQQDTGGFFVALLSKTSPLPWQVQPSSNVSTVKRPGELTGKLVHTMCHTMLWENGGT